MTTEAAATAETTESTATETASTEGPPAAEDIGAKYRDVLAAMDGDKPADEQAKPEDKPADKTEDKPADKTEDKPAEEEKPAAEEPEKKKDDGKLELQLAKSQREIKRLTTENVSQKRELDEARSLLTEFKTGNKLRALEKAAGMPFHEIMAAAARGDFDDGQQKAARLSPEEREIIEWAKAAKMREAEQKQAEATKAQRTADLKVVTDWLEEHGERFQFVDARAAEIFLEEAYDDLERTKDQPDLEDIAKRLEARTATALTKYLTSERAVRHVLTVQPVRELFAKVLGTPIQQQSPTSSKGAVVTKIPSASPEVTRASEPDDTADLVRGLEEFRRKQALGR